MPALLIIGALAAFYFLIEKQIAAVAPKVPVSTGVVVGSMPSGNLGIDATDSEVTMGLTDTAKATASVPIVGQLAGIAAQISGLFTAGHAAAVSKEATTLNNANPAFLNEVQQTVTALNQGAITPAQAIAYLQQAQSDWYTSVGPIIKGRWPYAGSQFPEPTWADSYGSRSGPYGSSDPNPDSHAPNPCDASCVLGHYFVERTVVGMTKIINAGGGSMSIEAFPNNGAIRGTPAVSITYTRPSSASPTSGLLQSLGL